MVSFLILDGTPETEVLWLISISNGMLPKRVLIDDLEHGPLAPIDVVVSPVETVLDGRVIIDRGALSHDQSSRWTSDVMEIVHWLYAPRSECSQH